MIYDQKIDFKTTILSLFLKATLSQFKKKTLSLKPIHFFAKIKLILDTPGPNQKTELTLAGIIQERALYGKIRYLVLGAQA